MNTVIAAFLLSAGVLSEQDTAVEWHLESGTQRVHLLELYTSEGCSSCPPADDWLSGLRDDPRLWRSLVPVAFHVDYWNYLGWRDRFANAENSARQRRLAKAGAFQVYTPGFVVNGREWRGGLRRRPLELQPADSAGVLRVTISGDRVTVRFNGPHIDAGESLLVHLAQLGFNLQTHVGAGENFGRQLEHNFTVVAKQTLQLVESAPGWQAETRLAPVAAGAVVAWVEQSGDPEPVQAVGGWLNQPAE